MPEDLDLRNPFHFISRRVAELRSEIKPLQMEINVLEILRDHMRAYYRGEPVGDLIIALKERIENGTYD